ncbi:anti-phage deoxyguanosine triphosphatase [Glaciecola petra]|uniref:Deoxyguanosinetriphosphate triphosphohydrolase-like protein n=1 Tax=Glaciecola petra TaxID=3075602 RepID=A0ABU2ZPI8_9ALTE|nr:anti-phage deoxyguanosine triphosphatase [Aestuariibacter sp. P117]MDT0594320.1 anti-phage deoxyguanosine triphosphatase [Aestuariibacter sp. P117]
MDIWSQRLGTRNIKRDGDHRNAFQRDKARVLHSASFRRLQAKTQVMGVGVSDFFRTRLTHSLEVAQIGTGIAAQLAIKQASLSQELEIDPHLIETICLAHDLGHPPFGHGGEIALHYMMHKYGGFEGNGQTFRILTKLEAYSESDGMNLARRSLLGIVKYPNFTSVLNNTAIIPDVSQRFSQVKAGSWHPPKSLYDCDRSVFDWIMEPVSVEDKTNFMVFKQSDSKHAKTIHKSIDCSIMELADDIAYAIHDLEDAIVMNLVNEAIFEDEVSNIIRDLEVEGLSENIQQIQKKLFGQTAYLRKNAIGALVNVFITAISIHRKHVFEHAILDYVAVLPEAAEFALNLFKNFVFKHVIKKPDIQLIEYKGQQIVMSLFEAFSSEPERLLPHNTKLRWESTEEENDKYRVIADYISGMTDEYANRMYANLFLPKSHNMSDSQQ